MKKTVIKREAANKIGMTFGEIDGFMQAAYAIQDAAFANNTVRARLSWRGTIRSLEITIEHDDN